MILWILFDCLLYGLTLFENGPNTDALTARIDVKNITIWRSYRDYVGLHAESLNMPRLPLIEKFRGDHTQSFPQWSLQLEVQLRALAHPEENWPMILMCLTDGNAFTTLQKVIEVKAKASYNDLKRALEERFCGDDYKRTLETKL